MRAELIALDGPRNAPAIERAAARYRRNRERYLVLAAEWRRRRAAVPANGLDGLERAHRIEITYTSNAIEGNTLTAAETADVIEKGITVAGKPLRDHLEAIDHARALDWVLALAIEEGSPLTEADIRTIHGLVVAGSSPEIAGRYADRARFVNTDTGLHPFPSPVEVPALMAGFTAWLREADIGAQTAFDAHRRLVAIHPFNDGNGRTARLLMNLLLVRSGHPPIAVRPPDRAAYHAALAQDQAGGGSEAFDDLMFDRLIATLDLYVSAAAQARPGETLD